MIPKEYQRNALKDVQVYLQNLAASKAKAWNGDKYDFDFADVAWENSKVGRTYAKHKDGVGRPFPAFCLKIPTGGGKTYLAIRTIDLLYTHYLKRQTGLVVWIVPSLQIYKQTIGALKDRNHPYRQQLDVMSAGRTLVIEKMDGFSPQDIESHLAVLLLMLPSVSRRKSKEALRVFRDNGAYQPFFPSEEDREGNVQLMRRIPNLETFEGPEGLWGKQPMTSLGNTIRLLQPLIILDEGHKAYQKDTQDILHGLNPCMILELTATPPKESNKLVVIGGKELHQEEMIKLDLNIVNKTSNNWRDTMRASMKKRDELEDLAKKYEANSNVYIRPICLVQVERTGSEQRDGKLIHAYDVRDYLLGQGVHRDCIAIKSSEIDELKEFDDVGGLLDRDCPIRYIITKQALQEGWDCSFAYILTVLTNPQSETALTQLVGRVLRQPYARKTFVQELDESYVYCFLRSKLLEDIREGFAREGLEDMQGRIIAGGEESKTEETVEVGPRVKLKEIAANLVLPGFMMRDGKKWRLVSYEADILPRIPWDKFDVSSMYDLVLNEQEKRDVELRAGLDETLRELLPKAEGGGAVAPEWRLDLSYASSHLLDVVPNPWMGYQYLEQVFERLLKKWVGKEKVVANNLMFILEELRKRLESERDRLAEETFNQMLANDEMRFIVVGHDLGSHRFPKKVTIKKNVPRATRLDGHQLELNLFNPVPINELNDLEHQVASFLDEQSRLYFWYRNVPHTGYYLQGWQKARIYADFIFATHEGKKKNCRTVFVLETKGLHLKNQDTDYKKSVLDLCNKLARSQPWNELVPKMKDKRLSYEVVFQDEWEKRLNELLKDEQR